ncbi:MAG: DeoR/GlpR transcriptional regulator [Phycisphaeraceae bacterium]|nr:DeoR/GlpR transcriptional regulator [Phycisphaeraceae bacterium]
MNKQSPSNTSFQSRREQILQLIQQQGECSIDALASTFDVSGMTIRRDLQDMVNDGQVIRTHGGATLAPKVSFEFRFLERVHQQSKEKEEIALQAVSLIRPGQTVLLDSSTTTLVIARKLISIPDVTVVTTSLPIASELYGQPGITVMLLGGVLRSDSPDLTGALTENCLEQICADIAFIGADAIDLSGHVYNINPEIGRMLKKMAASASRVYAVADHTKIGTHALMRFARITDWLGLITDSGVNRKAASQLRRAGVNLITPSSNKSSPN